jgi:hypothetical protein
MVPKLSHLKIRLIPLQDLPLDVTLVFLKLLLVDNIELAYISVTLVPTSSF